MADVDPIVVRISAEFGDLKKDLAQVQKEMKGFGKEVDGVGKKTDKVGKGFKGTTDGILGDIKRIRADFGAMQFAVVAVTGAFIGAGVAITKVAEAFREMDKTAKRLDIPVEEFSKFVVVAKKSGVNVETLGDAMKDLNVKITDAAGGAKAYEDVFNKIGLKSSELVKLPVAEQFLKFSDAIKQADSNTRRFALDEINDAMFQMIPLMEQGSEKIRELASEAERMGQSVSSSQADKLRAYNKSMTELGLSAENLANALAEHVVPALTSVADAVTSALNGIAEIIESSQGLTEALRQTREAAVETAKAFEEGRTIASSGAVALGQYSDEADRATTSLEALANAGESMDLDPFKNADASNFQLPDVKTPQVDDINVMFSQSMGEDNNGGMGGALARLLEENERKEEIAAEYQELKMNRIFEEMLEEGELRESARVAEEEAQKAFMDREFGAAKRQIDRLKSLEKSGWQGRFQMGMEFTKNIAAALDDGSRKSFERTKKLNMAEAVINTIGGVTKALNNPYPVNLLFAASVAAAGAAQIAKISSSSYGGGSGGGAAGVPEAVSAPEAAQAQTVSNFDVTLQGDNFGGDGIRSLIAQINGELDDGATIGRIGVR
jgi:hypothetical protein